MDILPPQEEFKYKEQHFFQSFYEQLQSSRKLWFWALLFVLLAAWPLALVLRQQFTAAAISRNPRLPLVAQPYLAQDIRVVQSEVLPVQRGVFSAYAQIVNPNPEIAARQIDYRFVVSGSGNAELPVSAGSTYLLPGQSKFVVEPRLEFAGSPAGIRLEISKVHWTKLAPRRDVILEILQKNTGVTAEGNFFVEGLVRNQSSFGIRQVDVQALVFDKANQNILAVNATQRDDLEPQESRYFRMLWPVNFSSFGEIQVSAEVNLLDPDLVLPDAEKIPPR